MAEKIFAAWNGPAPTTAGQATVATGTVIKTMLQIATPATAGLTLVEWGISFNGSAAATPVLVELVTTGAVAATVTAFTATDITRYNQRAQASLVTLGVGASGYTASAEGAITTVDTFDAHLLPPTAPFVKQWPLAREVDIEASTFLRVRVTAGTSINAICYVIWSE